MAKKTNGKQKARAQKARTVNLPKIVRSNKLHFQDWIVCSHSAKIAANQAVYHLSYNINSDNFPDLATHLDRFQTVKVNSVTARFQSGTGSAMPGMSSILALTYQKARLTDIPATPTHMWMNENGCPIKPITANVFSPPSGDQDKMVQQARKYVDQATPGTHLGKIVWVFEGVSSADARTHLGKFAVYLDAVFEGL